jgi:hypothetical protein
LKLKEYLKVSDHTPDELNKLLQFPSGYLQKIANGDVKPSFHAIAVLELFSFGKINLYSFCDRVEVEKINRRARDQIIEDKMYKRVVTSSVRLPKANRKNVRIRDADENPIIDSLYEL